VTTVTSTVSSTTTTTLATTSTLPAPQAPAAAAADSCLKGSWPADVSGRPTAYQSLGDGIYLWYDPDGGWALRVTHTARKDHAIFSGVLSAGTGKFVDVHGIGAGNDIVAVGPFGRTVLFRFVNFSAVDGLDFATRCTRGFGVDLRISGRLVAPAAVHLGGQGSNPVTNPFRVVRVAATNAPDAPGGVTPPVTTTTVASRAAGLD
jgi:hypothetical protein